MANNELLTLHLHSMFEISSMIQKAIRRGLIKDACYSASEMSVNYRGYLWKRLFTASSEDCFDLLSDKLARLKRADDENKDDRYIAEAVCYLVTARKNRDADYFACNLLNSKEIRNLNSIEPTLTEAARKECPTKNGHSMFDVSAALLHAIESGDYEGTGYCTTELYYRYKKYFWKTISVLVDKINDQRVTKEIEGLKYFDELQKYSKNASPIYVAKAMVVLIKCFKYGTSIFEDHKYVTLKFGQFKDMYMTIPDYVFDCHTAKGNAMGKTKRHFVVEEQKSLNPVVEGDFDKASWERFFDMEKTGFWNPDTYVQEPDKERMKELNEGVVQLTLF